MTKQISSDLTPWLPMLPPAILIDQVLDWGDDYIKCAVLNRGHNHFSYPDGRIPSCVCIEYIAQSACVFDGIYRSERSLPPRLAFLLGTRKIAINKAFFQPNEAITIHTRVIMKLEDSTYVFSSDIFSAEETTPIVENAIVKAIAPDNPQELIFNQSR